MADSPDIKNCSDHELVQKFRETRDNAIVGELFQRYTHLVFGVCMKYLKDEDEAKDGVMQIFEKILTDLHRHNVENFKGWIYMVAKNHCFMYFRSKKIHAPMGDAILAAPDKAAADRLIGEAGTTGILTWSNISQSLATPLSSPSH